MTYNRVHTRRDHELAKHGFSEGCLGCAAAQAGKRARVHDESCRSRITDLMAQDPADKLRLERSFQAEVMDQVSRQ